MLEVLLKRVSVYAHLAAPAIHAHMEPLGLFLIRFFGACPPVISDLQVHTVACDHAVVVAILITHDRRQRCAGRF